MSEIKWIKITTDIFDDEKILLIESLPAADSILVIWLKLLALAGKQNNSGVFMLNDRIPYTDEMLATIFRREVSTVRLALETFERFGMIDLIDGVITIPNWGKHQNIDSIERKREYMREYMRDYRNKQVEKIECKTNSKTNVSRTDKEIDKDKEKEIDIDKEKNKGTKRFVPPTLEEVKEYCQSRQNNIDPEYFIDYYQTRHWKLSKGVSVIDWKACVRTWERRNREFNQPKQPQNKNDARAQQLHDLLADIAQEEGNEFTGI